MARRAAAYADIRVGELGLVVDSHGLLSLALDRASASAELDALGVKVVDGVDVTTDAGAARLGAAVAGEREDAFVAGKTKECRGCDLHGISFKRHDLTGAGTVLLVEDDADVRRLTIDMLQELGYAVVAHPCGSVFTAARSPLVSTSVVV